MSLESLEEQLRHSLWGGGGREESERTEKTGKV